MFKACFVITEDCNLSCDYCYMKNRHVYMDRETFDYHYKTTLPYFMNHYKQDEYEIDIFGGEPLKNWFMVTHIIHHTKNDPKLKRLNLITNGLLLSDQRVEILKNNNVNCSLSFDGLWAQHLKMYVSLKPRLQKLFNKCSVCVTPRHMNMAENFRFIRNEFQLIPHFKIVRDEIWSKDDVEKFKFELDKLEEIYNEYDILPNLFKHRLDMLVESTKHEIKKSRCFVGNSGCAFSASAKVYPCARFLTNDEFVLYENEPNIEKIDKIDVLSNRFNNCSGCELEDHCDFLCLHEEIEKGIYSNVCDIYKLIELKALEMNEKNGGFCGQEF